MLQPVQKEGAIWQVGEAVVEGVVGEQFLGSLALGDVAVNDYQFVGLAF